MWLLTTFASLTSYYRGIVARLESGDPSYQVTWPYFDALSYLAESDPNEAHLGDFDNGGPVTSESSISATETQTTAVTTTEMQEPILESQLIEIIETHDFNDSEDDEADDGHKSNGAHNRKASSASDG